MTTRSPELTHLQTGLKRVLTDPLGVSHALETNSFPLEWIIGDLRTPARERLNVYGEGYFFRLLECLSQDFKTIKELLGERRFHGLIADYLESHPSTSPSVVDLGRELSGLLKTHPLLNELPYLADLALLEWTCLESFLSDRLPPISSEALGAISPELLERAILRIQPCVRLLQLDWPVQSLRESSGTTIERQSTSYLIDRNGSQILVQAISPKEWELGVDLIHSHPLSSVVNKASDPEFLETFFFQWMKNGRIYGLEKT
jgi:hypothetical protein